MTVEEKAFAYWRKVRSGVGFGDIMLVADVLPSGGEVYDIRGYFKVRGNPYGICRRLHPHDLERMGYEELGWRAQAEAESIRMQIQDPTIGALANR